MSLRTVVKARLVDVLTGALAASSPSGGPVAVSYAWPGRNLEREHVWLDKVEGVLEIPLGSAPGAAKQVQDDFTLDVVVQALTPGESAQEAEERVGALWDVILTALRDPTVAGPTLGLTAADGMQWVEVIRLRGPASGPTNTGWLAVARATLQFHTRIR